MKSIQTSHPWTCHSTGRPFHTISVMAGMWAMTAIKLFRKYLNLNVSIMIMMGLLTHWDSTPQSGHANHSIQSIHMQQTLSSPSDSPLPVNPSLPAPAARHWLRPKTGYGCCGTSGTCIASVSLLIIISFSIIDKRYGKRTRDATIGTLQQIHHRLDNQIENECLSNLYVPLPLQILLLSTISTLLSPDAVLLYEFLIMWVQQIRVRSNRTKSSKYRIDREYEAVCLFFDDPYRRYQPI